MDQLKTVLANPVVTLIIIIAIGAIIGWIYEEKTHSSHGYVTTALVGVAGSFTGYHLAALLTLPSYVATIRLIAAAVAALIVIWAWRTYHLSRKSGRKRR